MSGENAHTYELGLAWEGNLGRGTSDYAGYSRRFRVTAPGKPDFAGTADTAFRGEPGLHNPEELLLAAVSACHMLFYLSLCARSGIVVMQYADSPRGTLTVRPEGGGAFAEVTLRPRVTLAPGSDADTAAALHTRAGQLCFIANSCHFPVRHEAHVDVAREGGAR